MGGDVHLYLQLTFLQPRKGQKESASLQWSIHLSKLLVRIIHEPWPILGHSHHFPENHAPNLQTR
jgi:hypothetical protein